MPLTAANPAAAGGASRERAALWLGVAVVVLAGALLVPPGTLPYAPGAVASDAALSHWPNAHFLRESVLAHGQWPLWNPLRMLGQPFAANPLSKVWYPPQWAVLILPPTWHLNLMLYAHLGWLALGAAVWARAAALRPLAGLFAALAWGLGARTMAHLGAGHLDVVYALSWVFWLLWAAQAFVRAPGWGSSLRLAGVAALLALADVRVAFYSLPAALLGSLALAAGDPRPRRAHLAGAGGALATFLGLTAVQTVPLAALSPHLTRASINAQDAAAFSLPPRYLLGTALADAGGFHEWMTYLGIPALALAGLALARRPRRAEKVGWAVVGLLALLWSLGEHGPLFPPVVRLVPAAGWFRVPARGWWVVALAVTVLAAYGADDLLRQPPRGRARLVAAGLAAAGAALAGGALAIVPGVWPLVGTGAGLAATGLALWLAALERAPLGGWPPAVAAVGLLTAAQAASLLALGVTLVEGRPPEAGQAADSAVIASLGGFCDRVYSPSFELTGPVAAAAGVHTLHGVDPFQLRWSADAIAEAAGAPRTGYNVTAPPLPADTPDPFAALRGAEPDGARLAALGVTQVVSRFEVEAPGLAPVEPAGGLHRYDVDGSPPPLIDPARADEPLEPVPGRTHTACGQPPNTLLEATFDSLPFEGEQALLVLPQTWAPGWRAWIDGQPVAVQRAGGVFVGVPLDVHGAHTVRVAYRPAADLAGAGVTVGTVALLGMVALWHRGRAR